MATSAPESSFRPGRCSRRPARSSRTFAATQSPAEFTLKAIVIGALFGLLFGASTVYLGLRAGLTVSASIPIAVLAISVLKRLGGSTILENNIVQTIGSAGESVAGGVVFTVPALIFLASGAGYFNYFQITMLTLVGGILGMLMMVPLRRALIVKEHGILPYPEGTACAEVLVAGERGGKLAALVFSGLGVGALWKALSWIFNLFRTEIGYSTPRSSQFPNATLNVDISPEYLGVGYVIGPRIAGTMFAGGVLSWLVLLPLLSILGSYITVPFPPIHPNFANNPATGRPFLISEMAPGQLWSAYIRYIGAGAVLASGLITLGRTIPTIVSSALEGMRGIRRRGGAVVARTDREMPMAVVLIGTLLLALFLTLAPRMPLQGNILAAVLTIVFALLLRDGVVAHHRLDRHLVEPDLGHDDRDADPDVPALCRARLDRRQLRTGGDLRRRCRLHRGSERRQHVAGSQDRLHRRRDAAVSAAGTARRRDGVGALDRHHDALPAPRLRHRVRRRSPAPQATLMATIIKGLLSQNLPWGLVLVGVFVSITLELCGIRSLSVRRRLLPADRDDRADLRRRSGAMVGGAQHRRRRGIGARRGNACSVRA